jgi:hypothetical protein
VRLPYGSPMRVVAAADPALDAWRGAAHVAGARAFGARGSGGGGSGGGGGGPWGGALTREEYEERGPEYVKAYRGLASYW